MRIKGVSTLNLRVFIFYRPIMKVYVTIIAYLK